MKFGPLTIFQFFGVFFVFFCVFSPFCFRHQQLQLHVNRSPQLFDSIAIFPPGPNVSWSTRKVQANSWTIPPFGDGSSISKVLFGSLQIFHLAWVPIPRSQKLHPLFGTCLVLFRSLFSPGEAFSSGNTIHEVGPGKTAEISCHSQLAGIVP